jgi:hypothetical protein
MGMPGLIDRGRAPVILTLAVTAATLIAARAVTPVAVFALVDVE